MRCPLCPGCGALEELPHLLFALCALAMAEGIALCPSPLPKGILSHTRAGLRVAHGSCHCHSSARDELGPEAGGESSLLFLILGKIHTLL